jgi:DNA-binding NtrC family response regulator
MPTILVIDDNPAVATALETLFSLHDIDTRAATTPEEGLELLGRARIDLVVQDMNFQADTTSGEEGVVLFARIREAHPDLPVILLTAWTHLEAAVELVRAGAADYLAKPWDDRKLLATVNNLLELGEARRALAQAGASERSQRQALAGYDLRGIVYADPASGNALALACQVARSELPVLITGPNGAGKERYAEIVHANSLVKSGPFVALNCGALPAELVEAELFGAEAGAFTGATRAREGRFEAADGGTLFLDEIGNLPAAGQMKLLRVLETGEFERLGSTRTRKVKVRVISATNADLPALIRDGKFREDLYYRLNTIQIALPPLAERPDDILPLAEYFLEGAVLSDPAREALADYPWPGNVRELKNTIDRAKLLCGDSQIGVEHLGLPAGAGAASRSLDEPSRAAVETALGKNAGVISRAARSLGLSRQAFYRRMQRYGIPVQN